MESTDLQKPICALRILLDNQVAIDNSHSFAVCLALCEYHARCPLIDSPRRPPPHVLVDAAPEKLKAKEAKNVADILEQWQTFRSLADANMANSGDTVAAGPKMDIAGTKYEAGLSRLSVGLAVRQVKHIPFDTMYTLHMSDGEIQ